MIQYFSHIGKREVLQQEDSPLLTSGGQQTALLSPPPFILEPINCGDGVTTPAPTDAPTTEGPGSGDCPRTSVDACLWSPGFMYTVRGERNVILDWSLITGSRGLQNRRGASGVVPL